MAKVTTMFVSEYGKKVYTTHEVDDTTARRWVRTGKWSTLGLGWWGCPGIEAIEVKGVKYTRRVRIEGTKRYRWEA